MRRALILLCVFSGAAQAQEREVQRALMQRQQQSDQFQLQLRHSQQRLQLVPGDLNQQQDLDSQQAQQRQRLENLGAQQQLSIGQGTVANPTSGLIGERLHADMDRQTELQRPFELRLPPPQVKVPITPRPKDPDRY